MAEWESTTVGGLGTLFDGPHATPNRVVEGPYFLNIASLDNGRLDLSQSDHIAPDEFIRWTRRVTPAEGDLLFSYETRLGDAALMPPDVEACLGRRMALLRPDRSRVDPSFALYLYLSPAMQETIARNTIHGATVNRIALSTMSRWPVSIPPLATQQGIAEVLGALDGKIAANARLENTADELAQTIIASTAGNEHVRLTEIAQITMGSSPPGATLNEHANGIVFYQGVRDFGLRSPQARVWTTDPVRFAEAGDCLVSVRAPVGRVNIASERTCIGRGLASVRSSDGRPLTLFHLLRIDPGVWAPYEAEGTVFGSINRDQLAGIEVPRVEESEAQALEARLAAIEDRLAAALNESLTLAATRDALLPALMSGTLRVRDAERAVESMV